MINKILKENRIISGMMNYNEIKGVLEQLYIILEQGIEGDIVELGCNRGTTSLFIRRLLNEFKSDKKMYVYDSWEGLPDKHEYDKNKVNILTAKGHCKSSKDIFITNFKRAKLELPIINSGWFKNIPDNKYPDKICFAFYDGDFYTSIIDSFNKTFHKMTKNSRIVLDDCGNNIMPGVEKACNDFLKDKEEVLINHGSYKNGGLIIKIL